MLRQGERPLLRIRKPAFREMNWRIYDRRRLVAFIT
jgi:hypothetical protein